MIAVQYYLCYKAIPTEDQPSHQASFHMDWDSKIQLNCPSQGRQLLWYGHFSLAEMMALLEDDYSFIDTSNLYSLKIDHSENIMILDTEYRFGFMLGIKVWRCQKWSTYFDHIKPPPRDGHFLG